MKTNKKMAAGLSGRSFPWASLLLMGIFTLSVTACSDDLIDPSNGDKGVSVHFQVNDVQEAAIAQSNGMPTRGTIMPGLAPTDLESRKIAVHSSDGLSACLIETTLEGVNPIKAGGNTRAKVLTSIDADFSTSAYRGKGSISLTPNWFYKEKTRPNGTLYRPHLWSWDQPDARFYAVYPLVDNINKLTLSPATYAGSPYVDFEVEQDVTKQKDLMTACSGEVHYVTRDVAPQVRLDFRHALTAVKFAVGQNLSWNKTIDRVEIKNALYKGRYTLSDQSNGVGAAWDISGGTDRKDFVLSGLNVSTSESPNTIILGKNDDNYTFYMLPQQLTGKGVQAYIHFTDNTSITATLKGEWKAGTTKTYKLSQTNSTWNYVLTTSSPRPLSYTESEANYYVESYREDPVTHVRQSVKWKIVKYQESTDGGMTWTPESDNKPSWLIACKEEGPGGSDGGKVKLKLDKIVDKLKPYNDELKNAPQKGSENKPYNLSNQTDGGDKIENTANCYLISAPGYYRFPLVYGNAIKNGAENPHSYQTDVNAQYVLKKFLDDLDKDINSPYIWLQRSPKPKKADIVWLKNVSIRNVELKGSGKDSFVEFYVPADGIRSGNAVIAVKDYSDRILWSWHLWFEHADVLDKIPCTNHTGYIYNFSKRALGYSISYWEGVSYDKPREIRLKVEQVIGNGSPAVKQYSYITIIQNPGQNLGNSVPLYQFGRKDPLPIEDSGYLSYSLNVAPDRYSIGKAIYKPRVMFYYDYNPYDLFDRHYLNLWSMDNAQQTFNDNPVVKTIYDPSPVGFKMPASNAFTGFTTTGYESMNETQRNIDGEFDRGYKFWTNSSKSASIYFFASGFRSNSLSGHLRHVGSAGYYWTATPCPPMTHPLNPSLRSAGFLFFGPKTVSPTEQGHRADAIGVHPVAE